MSKLKIAMKNGCVAVIEGDEGEIVTILNKMMVESRLETEIKRPVNSKTKTGPSEKKRGPGRPHKYPFLNVPESEENVLNNLKDQPEKPMLICTYLKCLGFKRYEDGNFSGTAKKLLSGLEKSGVEFIYKGSKRFTISRDEQLKSLQFMIFRK